MIINEMPSVNDREYENGHVRKLAKQKKKVDAQVDLKRKKRL